MKPGLTVSAMLSRAGGSPSRAQLAFLLGASWVVFFAGACAPAAPDQTPAAEAPAHVEGGVIEAALTTVTLSPEAVARLGIETDTVRRQTVRETRSYGGVVEVPRGRSYTVLAPVAGTIVAPERTDVPLPGQLLAADQEVFRLLPQAPPAQDLIRLEAESEARVEAARLKVERAEQLLADRVGSVRQLEEARTELAVAEATYSATQAQLELLNRTVGPGGVPALSLVSPATARLATLHVAVGQAVSQSTAIFDVYVDDPLWIRVPVYVGEAGQIDGTEVARLHQLGGARLPQTSGDAVIARPVAAPPSADPTSATIDLFYSVPNPTGALRPGQRVGVTLSMTDAGAPAGDRLVVAHGAIVYDARGGAWVYEVTAPGTYVRRRVEIERVVGDLAVLGRGPEVGTVVVTHGVAELFGTEFGVSH